MKRSSFSKFVLKIVQQEGSPDCIARGAALGLFVGWMFPVGLQTLPVLFLAFVFRANKVLAWMFTCVTNPATIFFVYPVQCYVGSLVLFNPLKISVLKNNFRGLIKAETMEDAWQNFTSLGSCVLVPFFVGGLVFTLITAPLGYWFCYRLASFFRARRELRRKKRMELQGQVEEKQEKEAE